MGNIINSKIMVVLKEKYNDYLFVRCIASTVVGEAIDSIIFITVSFYGVFPGELIITMICCQVVFKVLYEIIAYPITRKIIIFVKRLDD